jgi:hypothetical protein
MHPSDFGIRCSYVRPAYGRLSRIGLVGGEYRDAGHDRCSLGSESTLENNPEKMSLRVSVNSAMNPSK